MQLHLVIEDSDEITRDTCWYALRLLRLGLANPNPNPNANPNSNSNQVKWCYNAMRLLQMPWLAGQAEVVAWTNARLGPGPERTPATTHLPGHLTRRWS